jgi:hypothetical protein
MTGRRLRALFNTYNRLYFGGSLSPYEICTKVRVSGFDRRGGCYLYRPLIEIQRGLSDAESISTLLHEMAHARYPGGHHQRWAWEMLRLHDLGAPLTGEDLDIKAKLDLGVFDVPINHPTKGDFRAVISAALADHPNLTLTAGVGWYIDHRGAPVSTATDFLIMYPWAKATYREALKFQAQRLKRRGV